MRLTGRRLPTFLNSNFFAPLRMFSTCSGLIDNKSFNVHITPLQNAPVHVVAESEVAQVDHLDHHHIPVVAIPVHELVVAEYRLIPESDEECRRLLRIGIHLSLIHISEPTRLGMISYAVFCLKKKKKKK